MIKFNGDTDWANSSEVQRTDIVILDNNPCFVHSNDQHFMECTDLTNGSARTHDWTSEGNDGLVRKVEKGSLDIQQKWS